MILKISSLEIFKEKERKMIRIKILPTPGRFDHIEIKFEIDGIISGFGYIGKTDKKIGLIRCPLCHKENYAPSVTSGQCTWCGFNANNCETEEE